MKHLDSKIAPIGLAFQSRWQTIAWLGVVAIIILTLMPKPPSVPGFLGWDKGQHVIAYACLMWWFRQAFARRNRWVILLITLGVMLEFIQGWTDYRYFEYGDMVANILGVSCGVILATTRLGRTVAWLDRLFNRNRRLRN